jgi:ubiquinone/menaquinone biosynthesis C-methylase UbiE
MKNDATNPWLLIPADDYEGHMSDENVGQLQALNKIFGDVLKIYSPESLCVLGCTTGNGFENIIPAITKKITGMDLNEKYLEILRERFGKKITGMELICADLNDIILPEESFDMIYAALIFEYIETQKALENIYRSLKKNGKLVAVLQVKNEKMSAVSKTQYQSLKLLSPCFNYVDSNLFGNYTERVGLTKEKSYEYDLKTGKKFFVGVFIKK